MRYEKYWYDVFNRAMNAISDTMAVADWPRPVRRAFVLTFPVSAPIYLVYFITTAIVVGLLGAIWALAECLQRLWEK